MFTNAKYSGTMDATTASKVIGGKTSAAKTASVVQPDQGVFLGQPSWTIPMRGLEDCLNIRIKQGIINSNNMGWTKFSAIQLDSPVCFVDQFRQSDHSRILVVGTLTDLYEYDTGSAKFLLLTPRYSTGTVTTDGTTTVVGAGTAWVANVKAGDKLYVGAADRRDPAGTWYTVDHVVDNTHLVTTVGVTAAGPGAAYTIRKTFQCARLQNSWHSAIFPRADVVGDGSVYADLMYFTNGVDYPMYWNPANTSVTVRSDFAFRCENIVLFKNMMIYMHIEEDTGAQKHMSIKNSDVGRPNTFVGGLANEFIVGPSMSHLHTGIPLGDDLIFYTEDEVIDCAFIGAPDVFAFRVAVPFKGVVGDRLVAAFPDFHQFLARDGLYWFNGTQSTPVDAHVWRYLSTQFDPNRADCGFVTFDYQFGDLIWAVPLLSDSGASSDGPPQYGFVGHYLEGTGQVAQPYLFSVHPFPYTIRNFPFSAAGQYQQTTSLGWDDVVGDWTLQNYAWSTQTFAANFPIHMVGDNSGFVYTLNTGNLQGTAPYASYAKFPRRPITDNRHRSLLQRLYPITDNDPSGDYTLDVTVSFYEQAGGPLREVRTYPFDLTLTSNNFVSIFRRARYFQVQFGTSAGGVGRPWDLHGYDLDVVEGGRR